MLKPARVTDTDNGAIHSSNCSDGGSPSIHKFSKWHTIDHTTNHCYAGSTYLGFLLYGYETDIANLLTMSMSASGNAEAMTTIHPTQILSLAAKAWRLSDYIPDQWRNRTRCPLRNVPDIHTRFSYSARMAWSLSSTQDPITHRVTSWWQERKNKSLGCRSQPASANSNLWRAAIVPLDWA